MKKTFKILSLILALVMSVSVFAVLPAFAVENTDYTVSNDSNTGKTTYTVKTATGLNEVVALVNAADSSNVIITLANDITFNEGWTSAELMAYAKDGTRPSGKTDPTAYVPLGTSDLPFSGAINGADFTISGLCISNSSGSGAALIAYGAGCTVSNVTLERSAFYAATNIGGIIGQYKVTSDDTEISAVNVVDTKLTTSATSGHTNIGGLVGDTDAAIEAINVNVDVDIHSFNSAGGVVGYSEALITVENANIIADIDGNHNLAGVVGHNTSGGVDINNISIDVTMHDANRNIGGVAGYSSANVDVNNADITVDISGVYDIGGVVGNAASSSKTITVENTKIKATITGTTKLIGGVTGTTVGTLNVENVNVEGDFILPETGASKSYNYVSGLVAYNTGSATIKNVTYFGNISGNEKTGGIVGESKGTLSITNAVVGADVAVTNSNRHNGGIVGCLNNPTGATTLSNCIYVGEVKKGGPIVGFTYGAGQSVTTTDCYTSSEFYGSDAVLIHGSGSGGTGYDVTVTTTPVTRAALAAKIATWANFDLDTEAYSAIFGSSIVAVQAGTDGATTPTPSIRFISTLDGVDYYSVGLIIKLTKVGTGTGTVDKETKAVYTSVLADGKPETAESFDADYLCAIGVNKLTAGVYKFEITSYVKTDANTVYYTDTATVDYELTSSGVALINGEEA